MHQPLNRRQAIGTAGLATLATTLSAAPTKKLPVAAIVTQYWRYSHADVIVGKILEGWQQKGGPGPNLELVSLYVDQFPKKDLSRGLAKKYGFRLAKTIDEAVTLGKRKLPVAGVLSIGEHGDYSYTKDTHQHMYPRRRFFDQILAAMKRCGQVVPLFNDKHLGYKWQDAKYMYESTKKLRIPFMAGSSLPVTWRYPAQEIPIGSQVEQALVVGHNRSESYLFHALEALQCMVERRRGGETGVASITTLTGKQILEAERKGVWNRDLLIAALSAIDASKKNLTAEIMKKYSVFIVIEYLDGMKATIAILQNAIGPMPPKYSCQLAVACKLRGQASPFACWLKTPGIPFPHFAQLLEGIDHMVHTRKPAYPVERTLLTTGVLDRIMHGMYLHPGKRVKSPELAIRYKPGTWKFANRSKGTADKR